MKWGPINAAWRVLRLRMKERPPIFYLIIIIIMTIIIFINCNWVVTRWQWLFYMYTKHEIGC